MGEPTPIVRAPGNVVPGQPQAREGAREDSWAGSRPEASRPARSAMPVTWADDRANEPFSEWVGEPTPIVRAPAAPAAPAAPVAPVTSGEWVGEPVPVTRKAESAAPAPRPQHNDWDGDTFVPLDMTPRPPVPAERVDRGERGAARPASGTAPAGGAEQGRRSAPVAPAAHTRPPREAARTPLRGGADARPLAQPLSDNLTAYIISDAGPASPVQPADNMVRERTVPRGIAGDHRPLAWPGVPQTPPPAPPKPPTTLPPLGATPKPAPQRYANVGEPVPRPAPAEAGQSGQPGSLPFKELLDDFDAAAAGARRAFAREHLDGVQHAARHIAMQANHFGLRTLARVAHCVEAAAKAKDRDAVANLLPDLENVVERNRIAMRDK